MSENNIIHSELEVLVFIPFHIHNMCKMCDLKHGYKYCIKRDSSKITISDVQGSDYKHLNFK